MGGDPVSNEAIHWAWKQTTGDPTAKLILHVLADLADEQHSCFPSIEHIVTKVEASEKTVRRRLEDLEAANLIRRERRYVKFGGRRSDRYYLDVEGQITAVSSLAVNLTANESTTEKSQVTPLEVNLTGNEELPVDNSESTASLAVNCDRYIETPQEIIDKSIIIDAGADAPRDECISENDELNLKLGRIHPRLNVEAVKDRLKRADVYQVDVLRAAQVVLGRATRPVAHPAAFVAKAIDQAPEAFRPQLPMFEPGSDVSGEPSARDLRNEAKAACARGNHDWGPRFWPECDRAECQRCQVLRRTVDAKFAALEDAEWDKTFGGDDAWGA